MVRGTLDVPGAAEAVTLLSRRGLMPVLVVAAPEPMLGRQVSARVQATLLRSLATLLDAGVPLAAAIQGAARVAPPRVTGGLARVEARVREGSSLAAALEAERGLCSPVTLGLVRAAENGVGLGAGLALAAEDLERRAESLSRVRAALAYPLVLLAVGSVSVLVILFVVVPRFAGLLTDVEAALPPAARLLIGASSLVRAHGVVLLALALGVIVVVALLSSRHRDQWHAWLIAAPLIGPVRHGLATARAARTLSVLLETGTPALGALRVARQAVGDVEVERRLAAVAERVSQGASLSRALEAERAFTPMALQMAGVGDGAGRLPSLLRRAADLEEHNAEQRLRLAITLLEPAIILAFAAMVALVAGSLLQAVYSLRAGLA